MTFAAYIASFALLWLAYEVRALRMGRVDEEAAERWCRAITRYAHEARIRRRKAEVRTDY